MSAPEANVLNNLGPFASPPLDAVYEDSQIALFGSIQSVALSLGVELRPIDTRDPGEIERAVSAFAGEPNGGLIVALGARVLLHRNLIITLAARHRLPAVTIFRLQLNEKQKFWQPNGTSRWPLRWSTRITGVIPKLTSMWLSKSSHSSVLRPREP